MDLCRKKIERNNRKDAQCHFGTARLYMVGHISFSMPVFSKWSNMRGLLL